MKTNILLLSLLAIVGQNCWAETAEPVLLLDSIVTPTKKTVYSYDSSFHRIGSIAYSKDNGQWVYSEKHTLRRDEVGKWVGTDVKQWKDGAWCDYMQKYVMYDTVHNYQDIVQVPYKHNPWDDDEIETYYINDSVRIQDVITIDSTQYKNKLIHNYYWAEDGKLTSVTDAGYIYFKKGWNCINVTSYKFSYHGDSIEVEYWAGGCDGPVITYVYNKQWLQTTMITYIPGGQYNIPEYKYEHFYDENGREIYSTTSDWFDNMWYLGYKYEYVYDDQGNKIYSQNYWWKDEGVPEEGKGTWEYEGQSERTAYYYYSDHTVGIENIQTDLRRPARKVLKSGTIYIEHDGRNYDLQGLSK